MLISIYSASIASTMAPFKDILTLRQKIELINLHEKEHLNVRKLGERYVLKVKVKTKTVVISDFFLYSCYW